MNIREQVLYALEQTDINQKINTVNTINVSQQVLDTSQILIPSRPLPGRPIKPELVDPKTVNFRSVGSQQGRASLLHAIAHIEFNAINLALDIIWRFPNMPEQFYLDWLRVAKEECYHFGLIREHLQSIGFDYGDFSAHNGLWDMSEKTSNDLLARLGLVPRTLEARGLDVNPGMQEKFKQIGDTKAVEILEIILRDEIGHVEIGNRWYQYMCNLHQLDPIDCYANLLIQYGTNKPKGPFNIRDRKKAGFTQAEIDWLQSKEGI
ncbi:MULTISPECIES: ferritin-like domain-containing protein [Pelistega]|uniref:ferritin-like domain-containing protein n=1 Tax=Pelistega TaxID=106146 RepID=UPI000418F8C4|nr:MULTISPECIES: ferritin-like domain-containing protein [Pelistega]